MEQAAQGGSEVSFSGHIQNPPGARNLFWASLQGAEPEDLEAPSNLSHSVTEVRKISKQ